MCLNQKNSFKKRHFFSDFGQVPCPIHVKTLPVITREAFFSGQGDRFLVPFFYNQGMNDKSRTEMERKVVHRGHEQQI